MLVLLTAPVFSEPTPQEKLLEKPLLEAEDIGPLIDLNLQQEVSVPEELALPRDLRDLLILSSHRVLVAMMLENYEALLAESQRRQWFIDLVLAYIDRVQPENREQIHPQLVAAFQTSAAMEVFARRQLRILKPSDLDELGQNEMFMSVPENMAEIHLLSARAALDQGDRALFLEHLQALEKACEKTEVTPLKIAYHCLKWRAQSDDRALLEAAHEVVQLGRDYKVGEAPSADIFWITAGDELLELCKTLMVRRESSPQRAQMEGYLGGLARMVAAWHKSYKGDLVKTFWLTREQLNQGHEAPQARIAVLLTAEKVSMLLADVSPSEQKTAWLSFMKKLLEHRHTVLEQSYWCKVPQRMYPVQGDFWSNSALERLDLRADLSLWKESGSPDQLEGLVARLSLVSPQDEAIEMLMELAQHLAGTERPALAVTVLERAELLAKAYHFRAQHLLILEQLLELQHQLEQPEQALETAQRGLQLAGDSVNLSLPLRDGRSPEQLVQKFAAELAAQKLAQGDAEAALRELEQGQAIASAHRISRSAATSSGSRGQAIRDLREARNQQDLASRKRRLGDQSEATTVAQSKSDFLIQSQALQTDFPELYDRVLTIKPVEFPRLQRHLPGGVVLLQYFPTDQGLFIFAIGHNSLVIKRLPLSKENLDQRLFAFLRSVRRRVPLAELDEQARDLHELLIQPVENELQKCETLLIVPSGRLNYLPFAALLDPEGRPLAQRFQLASLSKGSDLLGVLLKQPEAGKSLLVLANPSGDLPAAEEEGQALASLFPGSQALYGEKATRDALTESLKGTSFLHLATHGRIDPRDPSQSFLELAGEEKLGSDDIFALPLEETRLVTLSACNTALGRAEPTASVLSLAENFWVTGPASVVATLWAVDDQSTSVLMQEFYGGLRRGLSKGQALAAAQQKVRQTSGYEHPYFWSGFVLMGDWR